MESINVIKNQSDVGIRNTRRNWSRVRRVVFCWRVFPDSPQQVRSFRSQVIEFAFPGPAQLSLDGKLPILHIGRMDIRSLDEQKTDITACNRRERCRRGKEVRAADELKTVLRAERVAT